MPPTRPPVLVFNNNSCLRGTWIAPWVKCLTLDFGSGHDLTVREFESRIGLCAGSVEAAWDSFSLCLSLSLSLSLFLSLSLKLPLPVLRFSPFECPGDRDLLTGEGERAHPGSPDKNKSLPIA